MNHPLNANPSDALLQSGNIVQRLKKRIKTAQELGFRVRFEVLNDEQPSWCVVGKTKLLFLDLAQSANEQLRSLNETLASFAASELQNQSSNQSEYTYVDRRRSAA